MEKMFAKDIRDKGLCDKEISKIFKYLKFNNMKTKQLHYEMS